MNYFAHALPFLDRPYFAAGTGVPDWLTVADRQVRVRTKHAEPFLQVADPHVAAVAGGLLQHLRDDLRFHETRAFAETSLELAAAARRVLGDCPDFRASTGHRGADAVGVGTKIRLSPSRDTEAGFRTSFLGHLLVELLLDATLAAECLERLEEYYRVLDAVDALLVQQAVNRMAAKPTGRLAPMIFGFRAERIIWDYLEDDRLLLRLNQVMRRLGFAPLPASVLDLFPSARELVRDRRDGLLDGIPA